jgi:hypothetical protein
MKENIQLVYKNKEQKEKKLIWGPNDDCVVWACGASNRFHRRHLAGSEWASEWW